MLVLVDLDGTLIPLDAWDPVFRDVSIYIAERAGVDWVVVYQAAKEMNRSLLRSFSIKAFDWDYIFTEVARKLGVTVSIDINEFLIRHVREFKPYDGAIDLLRVIRDLGYGVIIATNGLYRYQSIVIRELGFSRYVDGIRTPDLIGCPKNCCEFFRGGLVMVGDNPLFDVYYPSMCGLTTMFIGDWASRLGYVRDVWGLDLSGMRPTFSFRSIKELLDGDRLISILKASSRPHALA